VEEKKEIKIVNNIEVHHILRAKKQGTITLNLNNTGWGKG
jgi:hypothetical protein